MLNARRVVAAIALAAVAGLMPVAAHAANKPQKIKTVQHHNGNGPGKHGHGPVSPTGWGWGG